MDEEDGPVLEDNEEDGVVFEDNEEEDAGLVLEANEETVGEDSDDEVELEENVETGSSRHSDGDDSWDDADVPIIPRTVTTPPLGKPRSRPGSGRGLAAGRGGARA